MKREKIIALAIIFIISMALFTIIIFYSPPYRYKKNGYDFDEEPVFECDEISSNGWVNLTVTSIHSHINKEAKWEEPLNWSKIKLYYYDGRGIIQSSDLIPKINGPKSSLDLSYDEWTHSGDDDIIDINESLYLKHSIYGTIMDINVNYYDAPHSGSARLYQIEKLTGPYEIWGWIRNNVLTLENHQGESINFDTKITLYSEDNNRNGLFLNFTVGEYVNDSNKDGQWSEGESFEYNIESGFLNSYWYFCYFVVYDEYRNITTVEEAHVYTS